MAFHYKYKFSLDKLNRICQESNNEELSPNSVNAFCAVKVLTYWLATSKDLSIHAFIKAIDVPFVGLKDKIEAIKKDLKNSVLLDPTEGALDYISDLPNKHEKHAYVDMKVNFCLELKFSCKIEDLLDCVKIRTGKSKEVFHNIDGFADVMNLLEKYNCFNSTDVSLLKEIANQFDCIRGLSVIEKYESQELMVDKAAWGHYHTSNSHETFLVARVDKTPENTTIKHISDAKSAASKAVGIKETDTILDHSEVSSVKLFGK